MVGSYAPAWQRGADRDDHPWHHRRGRGRVPCPSDAPQGWRHLGSTSKASWSPWSGRSSSCSSGVPSGGADAP